MNRTGEEFRLAWGALSSGTKDPDENMKSLGFHVMEWGFLRFLGSGGHDGFVVREIPYGIHSKVYSFIVRWGYIKDYQPLEVWSLTEFGGNLRSFLGIWDGWVIFESDEGDFWFSI